MAVTTPDTTLVVQKWRRNFWREWQRENLFAPYIGNGADAVISRIYELRDEGEAITIPMVGKLSGNGVSGDNPLVGNEEAMDQYGQKVQIDWWRHAVLLNKKQMRRSVIDQMDIVRPLLMDHAMRKLRDDIIKAIVQRRNGYAYRQCERDLLSPGDRPPRRIPGTSPTVDRVQYGSGTCRTTTRPFATALANINRRLGRANCPQHPLN
jgi:hypothetical protein